MARPDLKGRAWPIDPEVSIRAEMTTLATRATPFLKEPGRATLDLRLFGVSTAPKYLAVIWAAVDQVWASGRAERHASGLRVANDVGTSGCAVQLRFCATFPSMVGESRFA